MDILIGILFFGGLIGLFSYFVRLKLRFKRAGANAFVSTFKAFGIVLGLYMILVAVILLIWFLSTVRPPS